MTSAMAVVRTILRCATGRRARRVYLTLLLLVVALSGVIRVRSFLLTRKIQAVVSGLQQLRVDVSTEADVRRAVPSLVFGVERVSNDDDLHWIESHVPIVWPVDWRSSKPRTTKWQSLSLPLWVAYALGWRHISFDASVTVVNGVVSHIAYDLDPDVLMVVPSEYMIVVRSAHGVFFSNYPAPVGDVDDEAPDYRFGRAAGSLTSLLGSSGSIGLAYTADAPRDLVSHAYEADLSCFWGLFGCSSARQVLPRLWEDREAVIRAAATRLASPEPCPDRILAGRVTRLPDLVIERREVTDPGLAGATISPAAEASVRPGYRLDETIQGNSDRFPTFRGWKPERYAAGFLWRRDPAARTLKTGDKVLVFLGVDFQSCRIVPATASAEAALRAAVRPPRRNEDNIMSGRQ